MNGIINKANQQKIERALQRRVRTWQPLAGGMISQVMRVDLHSGESVVAKIGDGGHDLSIEAYMLRYLREHSGLPVPEVLHDEANLLLMEFVEGRIEWEGESLRHLGVLLARCHQVTSSSYGHARDTLIGPLHQPNGQMDSWIEFFRERRLLYMIGLARASGELPVEFERRLYGIADRLDQFLAEPSAPVLIHGDMWKTNVISRAGQVVGILDPALYYAHNDMELAYMTLFSGTGDEFFRAYAESIPIDDDFYTTRRHLYNLYPLLIHLIIFGAKYLPPLHETIAKFER